MQKTKNALHAKTSLEEFLPHSPLDEVGTIRDHASGWKAPENAAETLYEVWIPTGGIDLMITFTGIHCTREFGAASIRDMAVQGMRICRFAGAFEKYFWPIAMHSHLVADLLPERLEHHALLHDVISEIVMSDIPRPFKTDEQKAVERDITERGYKALGLALPTQEEAALLHAADMKAVNAEGTLGCGPRGYTETQTSYSLDGGAAACLSAYLSQYDVLDYLNADGGHSIRFEARLRKAIRRAHQAAKAVTPTDIAA